MKSSLRRLFGKGFVLIFPMMVSCRIHESGRNDAAASRSVKDSVRQMMARIAADVSNNGPIAWLTYFEDTTAFFMASDGRLVFQDHRSARDFIENTLPKIIHKINLRWVQIRVDSLSPALAAVAASFHEDITDTAGKVLPSEGYFTGIAEQAPDGWQLRNAHWSIVKKE